MSISFKVSFGNDVRRFTLPMSSESNLLAQLMNLLGKLYDLTETQVKNLELKYLDIEHDLITIAGPYDLKEAFCHMTDGLLRLQAKVSDRQRIVLTDSVTNMMETMNLNPEPVLASQPVKENRSSSFSTIYNPAPYTAPILISVPKKDDLFTVPLVTNTVVTPPIVQRLDLSKLQNMNINPVNINSPTISSSTPVSSDRKNSENQSAGAHGINSSRGSQTITSSHGGSVTIKGGGSVSTTHGGNVSVSHAGGTIVMNNTHGSSVITKQGSGIISGKGSSLIVQKK